MQNIKIYGFYGVTFPMLLTADDDSVKSIVGAVSNGASARLLSSLYLEGCWLKEILYHSGRFTYSFDEESKQCKSLIKFVDFNRAYRKYREQLEENGVSGHTTTGDHQIVEHSFTSGELQEMASVIDMALDSQEMQATDILPLCDLLEDQGAGRSTEEQSVNRRLLEALSQDYTFDMKFEKGDYHYIVKHIQNWEPEFFFTLRDLRFTAEEQAELEKAHAAVASCKRSVVDLAAQPQTELTRVRVKTMREDLAQKEAFLLSNSEKYEFFSEDLGRLIEREKKNIPRKLNRRAVLQDGRIHTLDKIEYTIISALHERCSQRYADTTMLEYLLDLLQKSQNASSLSKQKYLNCEFAQLSTKESRTQLSAFNRQYRDFLKNFKGTDLIKIIVEGIEDCKLLLNDSNDSEASLQELFYLTRKDRDLRSIQINGRSSVNYAISEVMKSSRLLQLMQLGNEPVCEEYLEDMLIRLADTSRIIDVVETDASFAALYKVWHFIRKNNIKVVLNKLGLYDEVDLGKLRELHSKLGILGLYVASEKMFFQCCDVGVTISNGKNAAIRKKQKPKLYENLQFIQRYLTSYSVMLENRYQVVDF